MAQQLKNPSIVQRRQETQVQSLGLEDPLEKEVATHSRILAWEIPCIEEPGRLQSTGSQKSWTKLSTKNKSPSGRPSEVNQNLSSCLVFSFSQFPSILVMHSPAPFTLNFLLGRIHPTHFWGSALSDCKVWGMWPTAGLQAQSISGLFTCHNLSAYDFMWFCEPPRAFSKLFLLFFLFFSSLS